jgi:hypothetical protein
MERLAAGAVSDPTAAAVPLAASTVLGWVARALTSAATLAPRVEALLMAMTVQQRLCGCPSLSTSIRRTFRCPRAQFVLFLERYPQVKEQNLYTRLLSRS